MQTVRSSAPGSARWTRRKPTASAVAWRGGEIVAVGSDAEIKRFVGPGTHVVDGRSLAVVPGLVDSHIHPFWGTIQTRGVDLRSALTIDEVRARLAGERARCGPDQWVLGHSVGYEPFHGSGIRADAIAEAIGEGPALVSFFDGHTALASPAALALAGVSGAREFDEYAEVVIDPDGRPTGALLEAGAMDLVRRVVPRWTEAETLDAFAQTLRAFNRGRAHRRTCDARRSLAAGRVPDARGARRAHGPPADADAPAAVDHRRGGRGAARAGRRARAAVARRHGEVLSRRRARVRYRMAGGRGPRRRERGRRSGPTWGAMPSSSRRFTAAGFSAITHAVGDGAVRGALDAYEAAGPPRRGKHRVEHIETLTDADLPRFAALDVAASMQPLHMEGMDDPDTPSPWAEGLSEGRLERGFRTRDLVDAGALLPLGSDWMVADYDPRVGMAWARLRRAPGRPDHVPFLPEQALVRGARRCAGTRRRRPRWRATRRCTGGYGSDCAPTSPRWPPIRARSLRTSCRSCRSS